MSDHFFFDVIEPLLEDHSLQSREELRLRSPLVSETDCLRLGQEKSEYDRFAGEFTLYLRGVWPDLSPLHREFTREEEREDHLPVVPVTPGESLVTVDEHLNFYRSREGDRLLATPLFELNALYRVLPSSAIRHHLTGLVQALLHAERHRMLRFKGFCWGGVDRGFFRVQTSPTLVVWEAEDEDGIPIMPVSLFETLSVWAREKGEGCKPPGPAA